MNPAPVRSIAALLEDLERDLPPDAVSVADIAEALHERGIAMLLLAFAAPMALPIPEPPVVNIMLGVPLVLLTAQQAMGAHTLWLPRWLKKKTIGAATLRGAVAAVVPWLRKIEIMVRPRLGMMTQDGFSRLFGLLGLLMALAILVPVPLFHSVPSLGIAVMAVGFIMRDGLAVIAGAMIGMCWITMLAFAIIFFGPAAVDTIREVVGSWM